MICIGNKRFKVFESLNGMKPQNKSHFKFFLVGFCWPQSQFNLAKVIERKRGIKVKPSRFTRTLSLAKSAVGESGGKVGRKCCQLNHFYCLAVKRHDKDPESVGTTWRMRNA